MLCTNKDTRDARAWSKLSIFHFKPKSFQIACTHYYIHSSSGLASNCRNTGAGVLLRRMHGSFSTTMPIAVYHVLINKYSCKTKCKMKAMSSILSYKTSPTSKALQVASLASTGVQRTENARLPLYTFYYIDAKIKTIAEVRTIFQTSLQGLRKLEEIFFSMFLGQKTYIVWFKLASGIRVSLELCAFLICLANVDFCFILSHGP